MGVKFWLEDCAELFRNPIIFSNCAMTEIERLNALTRLIIIIALLLFIFKIGSWLTFLILGLILIIIMYYSNSNKSEKLIENYRCPKRKQLINKKIKFKHKTL